MRDRERKNRETERQKVRIGEKEGEEGEEGKRGEGGKRGGGGKRGEGEKMRKE